jgi:hypothetical protein
VHYNERYVSSNYSRVCEHSGVGQYMFDVGGNIDNDGVTWQVETVQAVLDYQGRDVPLEMVGTCTTTTREAGTVTRPVSEPMYSIGIQRFLEQGKSLSLALTVGTSVNVPLPAGVPGAAGGGIRDFEFTLGVLSPDADRN